MSPSIEPLRPPGILIAEDNFLAADALTDTVRSLGNCVLDTLPSKERLVIQNGLEKVVLKEGDVLEEAGQPTAHVYFPINALISIRAGVERGTGIEVASVGHDSMTAPGLLLGDPLALGEAVVQSGGWAWRLPAPAARALAERHPFLRKRFLRQVARSLSEIVDTSMLNGRATIVERLARWLVHAAERPRQSPRAGQGDRGDHKRSRVLRRVKGADRFQRAASTCRPAGQCPRENL